ncbi:hypothetical protein EE612_057620 [Oryza sativa]|nr:hypothetical protein EE612_057620 [Oryza sativa]
MGQCCTGGGKAVAGDEAEPGDLQGGAAEPRHLLQKWVRQAAAVLAGGQGGGDGSGGGGVVVQEAGRPHRRGAGAADGGGSHDVLHRQGARARAVRRDPPVHPQGHRREAGVQDDREAEAGEQGGRRRRPPRGADHAPPLRPAQTSSTSAAPTRTSTTSTS